MYTSQDLGNSFASQLQSVAHNKMFVKVDHLILKLLNPPFFFLNLNIRSDGVMQGSVFGPLVNTLQL